MLTRPFGEFPPRSTTNAANMSGLASENPLNVSILRLDQRQIRHDHTLLRLLMT